MHLFAKVFQDFFSKDLASFQETAADQRKDRGNRRVISKTWLTG